MFCAQYSSLPAHLPHVHESAGGRGSFGEAAGPASGSVLPGARRVLGLLRQPPARTSPAGVPGSSSVPLRGGGALWRGLTVRDGLAVAASCLGLPLCDVTDIRTPTPPFVASSLLFVGWFAVCVCVSFYCPRAGGHLFLRQRKERNIRLPAYGPLCSELRTWAPRCSSPRDS